jgi:hypothetical protein
MPEEESKPEPKARKMTGADWTKIIGGCLGVVLVALQGVNLSETSNVAEGGEKRTVLLEKLIEISHGMNDSLNNQTLILQNDTKMIQDDSLLLQKQELILSTINDAIEKRRELLEQDLKDLRERQDRQGERQDRQGDRQDRLKEEPASKTGG